MGAIVETNVLRSKVDAIAKVPGIDVLFVGPFDLGNNIGHSILDGKMHNELKEAIGKIKRAAEENQKRSGIYATSGDQAREFADQGFNMVSGRRPRASQKADEGSLPGIRCSGYGSTPSIHDFCIDCC